MKKLSSIIPVLAGGVLLLAACSNATAKESHHKKPAKAGKSWKAAVKVDGKEWYDTNTFLLSGHQITRLQSNNPSDQISGRFKDMNSVSDYVFTPSLGFLAEGPGIAGRKLGLEAGVHYDMYALNPRRRHVGFDFAAEQSTSRNGKLRAKFDYIPSYFDKNFLADATNYTSSVTASERVYKPDTNSQWDVTVGYRYRLAGGKAALLARGGYWRRRNVAPFVGRDQSAPNVGGGVNFNLTSWWKFDGGYEFASVESPRVQEVMILNEPDFNVDFNNDGDASELNIRTVQFVNRSNHAQFFRANTRLGIRETSDFEIGYERRHRDFLSKEPFDRYHNGRSDNRDTIHATYTSRFGQRFQFTAGYVYSFETASLPNDPGIVGEVTDYKRSLGFLGLSYRF